MKQQYNALIESLGVYLPEREVSTEEVMNGCNKKLEVSLEKYTGIISRRVAGEAEFSYDLAEKAVEDCLKISKYQPEDIDLLVCCTVLNCDGPDSRISIEPGTSVRLKKKFNFKNALPFDVKNACASMFTGIKIVQSFIQAGAIRRGLVVSGEYVSNAAETAQKEIENIQDPRVACLTLGDAGAALILESTSENRFGFHELDLLTIGEHSSLCIGRPTEHDHGGIIMFTDSKKLLSVAIVESVKHIVHTLSKRQWPISKCDKLICHQVSRKATKEGVSSINSHFNEEYFNDKNVIDNVENRGNTASTTHTVALMDGILNNQIKNGDTVLFGIEASGLTIGTGICTLDDLPDRIRNVKNGKGPQKKLNATPKKVVRSGLESPVIRIESIGVLPLHSNYKKDSFKLAKLAGEECLKSSIYDREDIGLLIYVGVHKSGFIFEPAIAAMLAGDLRLNDSLKNGYDKKTFAFDLVNGAVGWLNACYVANQMIQAKSTKRAMLLAAEVENNFGFSGYPILGFAETASAVIIEESIERKIGFSNFIFESYTEYLNEYHTYLARNRTKVYVELKTNGHFEDHMLDCISKTVRILLKTTGKEIADFKAIIPPQISPRFISKLANMLAVNEERLIQEVETNCDLYTSSIPYGIYRAQRENKVCEGELGLIISVGSGIQVGCAVYHF